MTAPIRIGFALTGSFCTFAPVLEALEELHTVFPDIIPIMSDTSYETDSRFGDASSFPERLEAICSHEILHTFPQVVDSLHILVKFEDLNLLARVTSRFIQLL